MSPREVLSALERIAREARVEVRWDRGVGRGGLCRVGTKAMVLGDASLPVADKIALLFGALVEHGVEVPENLALKPPKTRSVRKVIVNVPPERGPKKAVPRPSVVEARRSEDQALQAVGAPPSRKG